MGGGNSKQEKLGNEEGGKIWATGKSPWCRVMSDPHACHSLSYIHSGKAYLLFYQLQHNPECLTLVVRLLLASEQAAVTNSHSHPQATWSHDTTTSKMWTLWVHYFVVQLFTVNGFPISHVQLLSPRIIATSTLANVLVLNTLSSFFGNTALCVNNLP